MMNIEDYNQVYAHINNFVKKCNELQDKYNINVALNLKTIDVENIEWIIERLEKYNILTLYENLDDIRIEIDVDGLEINIIGISKYIKDGKVMSCEFNWGIDGGDHIETDISFYIHENCENCKNWNTPNWDYDCKYHKPNSKIANIYPENDIDGKGGIGYWTFVRKKEKEEFNFNIFKFRNLYKHNEITEIQKSKLLGCKYAFCDGCPMSNNKINTLRQIRLHTISKKAATTYDHCEYFEPNSESYDVGNHPVKLVRKIDGIKVRKWGILKHIIVRENK